MRYFILGESYGRVLVVILEPSGTNEMNKMRKYIAKDEEDLIKQLESDQELDKELEKEKLVKGHIVEIIYTGKAKKQVRQGKNRLHRMRDAL